MRRFARCDFAAISEIAALVERRFVIFVLLVALIWLTFIPLQIYLASKRPQAKKAAADQVAKVETDQKAEAAPDQPPSDEPKPAAADEKPESAIGPAPAAPLLPRQWLTLGSTDPSSGYSGLYYFD